MTENSGAAGVPASRPYAAPVGAPRSNPSSLADVLERVLDKGIIIAGDIRVNLLDIELLTIKIRLLVVSVDKAQEMGIDWWRNDPMLTTSEQGLADENRQLRERLEELEGGPDAGTGSRSRSTGAGSSGSSGSSRRRSGSSAGGGSGNRGGSRGGSGG